MIGSLRNGCKELSPRYSEFVDGATSPLLTDVIDRHLLECDACVAEVNALRDVRAALGATGGPSSAADSLQSRLLLIAGESAGQPLALRSGCGALPTRVQARRRIVAAGVLFTVAAILAWSGVGLAASPPLLNGAQLADEARADFSATLNRTPLENPAVVAFLASDPTNWGVSGGITGHPSISRRTPVDHPAATLTRAVSVQTSAEGSARVTVLTSSGYRTADADVWLSASGSTVTLKDSSGRTAVHGFLPRTTVTQPDWLAGDYTLAGWTDAAVVAGRSATVIEASLTGTVSARWWVDAQSGLVLWQERYADNGAITMSAGFTEFSTATSLSHPSGSMILGNTEALSLSGQSACPSKWVCADALLGLPLVWRSADRIEDPAHVQSVYSDGVTTIEVQQRRGTLLSAPSGFSETTAGFEADGMPAVVMWQSGGSVISVATNGCLAQARNAAAALPHEPATYPDPLNRIAAGWARITGEL